LLPTGIQDASVHFNRRNHNIMNIQEKLYSIFSILFVIAFVVILGLYPESRQLKILLPITFAGLMVNIIFMFIVLRDIFLREFETTGQKILWVILILFLWPAVLVYLPKFGFKPRNASAGNQ
jgi:hypothetical protein